MIVLRCSRSSPGLALIRNKINELGDNTGDTAHVIYWGSGGGDKYAELTRLADAEIPVPPHSVTKHPGWLARTKRHKGARDLLRARKKGDYYVEYVPTTHEYRVHVVDDKVIRVQKKVPRTDTPHPRFRSHGSGWKLVATPEYSAELPKGIRAVSKRAVAALEYVFGAVDVGIKEDGSPLVFEVNTQPGLEGGTAECYARAFLRMCQ
jgi:glutathione synthase/RimK-type ligase-like ATP-grasp enzyme